MRATLARRGLWDRITSGLAGRRLAGKDLSGNKYYEVPNPAGGRVKRVVEYADSSGSYAYSSVDDYRQGTAQLPVQWSAWLSHTRSAPPSLAELQTDAARQTRLRARVAEIEERERQERIQQGFLLPDGTEPDRIAPQQQAGSLHLPSPQAPAAPATAPTLARAPAADTPEWTSADGTPHASSRFAFPPAPDTTPIGGGSRRRGSRKRASASGAEPATAAGTAPGSTTPAASPAPVAPPRPKVDPSATPASDLRRLAEEDTRRRLRQSGASEEGTAAGAGPAVAGVGRGLRPKRRGG